MNECEGEFGLVLRKERQKFSAAHMTVFPDGSKEPLHGHNFQVDVSVDLRDIKFESFLDFGVIHGIVSRLCSEWDNKLLLASENKFFKIVRHDSHEIEFLLSEKRYVIPSDEVAILPIHNIAVENLADLFADLFIKEIRAAKQDGVCGCQITISETYGQGGVCTRKLLQA